jgi:hypothetical protein
LSIPDNPTSDAAVPPQASCEPAATPATEASTATEDTQAYQEDLARNVHIIMNYALTVSEVADAKAQCGNEPQAIAVYLKSLEQLKSIWLSTNQFIIDFAIQPAADIVARMSS